MDPIGLTNLGSTCYLNTCLQLLFTDTNFVKFLNILAKTCKDRENMSELVHRSLQMGKKEKEREEFARSLIHLAFDYHEKNRGVRESLRSFLTQTGREFKGLMNLFEQNDLQEFLTLFIDKLVMASIVLYPLSSSSSSSGSSTPKNVGEYQVARFLNDMEIHWKRYHFNIYSHLTPVYHGQLVKQLKCKHRGCEDICHNVEVFTTLILDGDSLEEGLKALEKDTIDRWRCDKCGTTHESVEMMTKITRFPKTLIVCFKNKNNKKQYPSSFEFPHHMHMLPETVQCSLMSVACHVGNQHNGHYYALIGLNSKEWLVVDDEHIGQTGIVDGAATNAYVLFYSCRS